MHDLPEVHTLWVGQRLGPLSVACLKSFLVAGHRVVLHAYEKPDDVPSGVIVRDAAETIPRDRIVRHRKTGSYALFSDIFRYRLLQHGADLYVDCDVYCLRPIERADYIFGYETDTQINGAVLALPPGSPLINALNAASEDRYFVPPWLSPKMQRRRHWAMRLGLHPGTVASGWGTLGPRAITYYARSLGVADLAAPMDVFYPVDSRRTAMLYDPDLTLADITTHRTICIHLYNEMIRRMNRSEVPPSSPLGRMLQNDINPLLRAR